MGNDAKKWKTKYLKGHLKKDVKQINETWNFMLVKILINFKT